MTEEMDFCEIYDSAVGTEKISFKFCVSTHPEINFFPSRLQLRIA